MNFVEKKRRERVKNLIDTGDAYTKCSRVLSETGYLKVDHYNYDTGWGTVVGGRSFMLLPGDIVSLGEILVRRNKT